MQEHFAMKFSSHQGTLETATSSAKILKAAGRLQNQITSANQAPINRLILTKYVCFMSKQLAILQMNHSMMVYIQIVMVCQ